MVNFILILNLVLLFLVYRKLSQYVDSKNTHDNPIKVRNPMTKDWGVEKWLELLNNRLHEIQKNMSSIDNHFLADNPAGIKSDRYKKMNNLIKILAQHLSETEGLSEKNALIRARFEIHKFGEENAMEEIDNDVSNGVFWKDRNKAEDEYYKSDILDEDIKKYGDISVKDIKKVSPYYLAAPMYDVIVKQEYDDKKYIELGWIDEYDYYSFIKHRAIIFHLVRLGIIKKANNEEWGGKPKWIIPEKSWNRIKEAIYEGNTAHDDSYFEEQYREGKLNGLFNVTTSLEY